MSSPPLVRQGNWGTKGRARKTPRPPDTNPECLTMMRHCSPASPWAIRWLCLKSSVASVLDSPCCCHNYHNLEIYSLTVQKARSSKLRRLWGSFPLEALSSRPQVAADNRPCSSACSSNLCPPPSRSCVTLCLCVSASYKDPCHWI